MAIRKVAEAALPTKFGSFRIFGFEDDTATETIVALVMGTPWTRPPALVRIHSQCLTGENFFSSRCDCGDQLELALQTISEEGEGMLIYQHAEGRGIGLMNKLLAYELQDSGRDTVEANHQLGFDADVRSYTLCAAVLNEFEIRNIRLMSNNPRKVEALEKAGIEQVERVSLEIPPSLTTEHYLRTKKIKLGHLLRQV